MTVSCDFFDIIRDVHFSRRHVRKQRSKPGNNFNFLDRYAWCWHFIRLGFAPSRSITVYSCAAGEKATRTALSPTITGETAPEGFDCSSLFRYSYLTAGIDAPLGTEFLMKVTKSLSMRIARRSGLLFFEEDGKNIRTSAFTSATISSFMHQAAMKWSEKQPPRYRLKKFIYRSTKAENESGTYGD